jgi:glutaredoxin
MKNNIRVFGMEGCSYCEEIKTKLSEGNIEYQYVDIDSPDNQDEVFKVFNIAQTDRVPVILVGGTILVPEKSFDTIDEAYDIIKRFIG